MSTVDSLSTKEAIHALKFCMRKGIFSHRYCRINWKIGNVGQICSYGGVEASLLTQAPDEGWVETIQFVNSLEKKIFDDIKGLVTDITEKQRVIRSALSTLGVADVTLSEEVKAALLPLTVETKRDTLYWTKRVSVAILSGTLGSLLTIYGFMW